MASRPHSWAINCCALLSSPDERPQSNSILYAVLVKRGIPLIDSRTPPIAHQATNDCRSKLEAAHVYSPIRKGLHPVLSGDRKFVLDPSAIVCTQEKSPAAQGSSDVHYGAADKDRTCGPYRVRVVLSR